MSYLVRLSMSNIKEKHRQSILDVLENPKLDKFVLAHSGDSAIIRPELFDYLQFEIECVPAISKNIEIALIKRTEQGKHKVVIDDSYVNSENYSLMLRALRFGEKIEI